MRYIFGKGVGYAFKGLGLMTRFQKGNSFDKASDWHILIEMVIWRQLT